MERVILHSDLNNFYASVECLYNPAIRDKPVAVCGNAELRHGIILAKNYLAKGYGIQTGEAIWQAKQKCKDLVLVPPHYDLYLKFSALAREIYGEYTDKIEPFGLDECWLDVTGSTGLFGNGVEIANEIRQKIKEQMGVTASVGVSFNKIFAKLGSDYKKPDATTVITKDNYRQLVWPLPASDLLYVGRSTAAKLASRRIHTIGDLAQANVTMLEKLLGKNGVTLWNFANGRDRSPVAAAASRPVVKSIGNSTTCPRDLILDEEIKITLMVLSESVAARLRSHGLLCTTIQIGVRDNELHSYQRQAKLPSPTCVSQDIFRTAFWLFQKHYTSGKPIRSLSVRGCNLVSNREQQMTIYDDFDHLLRNEAVEHTVDTIRRRFGHFAIQRGVMMNDKLLSSLNPQEEHTIHPTSFFR